MENTSDHNRKEAFKAKKIIALEKMENNDFGHAKQIIFEAQEICPELAEDMSQMLLICNIHCAADSIVGCVKDLYGILQVEQTADESVITKQYRRMALSTHPDKNKLAGAPDAFKLVAEAYSVLSDPEKRTEHNYKMKCESKEANDKTPSNKTDANKGGISGSSPTFWTKCPRCQCRFQYFKTAMNRGVECQTCKKAFIAYPLEDQQQPMPEHDWKRKNNTGTNKQSSQNNVSSDINMEDKIEDNDEKCYSDPVINVRDINSITYNDGGVDQIWALYDTIDHMPRSYAMIKCVGHSKCLYWLKFYPLSEEEKEWNNKTLPVACGKFCLGEKADILENSSLYSHTVEFKEICVNKVSGRRGSAKTKMMVYEIYPKRDQVWALYKGWSKQWNSSDADKSKSYDYEVVEVLSDMSENGGANVIPLIRIEGFPSLLVSAKDKSSFHVPSSEVFRFSHRIPHYRVSGHENILNKINGPTLEKNHIVPEGFLLLDSSCLPSDLDATFASMSLDAYISQSKNRSRQESQYEIFPQVGEIWGIYMDWAPEQSSSSTDCCELAVGEIIERNNTCTKVSFLAKVDGTQAVFKPDKQKGVLEIPTRENLRFSHHILSSFRVMKEKGDKRRVFYDLDPAYLGTAQDHTTASGNRSTVEDLTKEQKTADAQVGPRRTARTTRPNSRYAGHQWPRV